MSKQTKNPTAHPATATEDLIEEYKRTMTEQELLVLNIAVEHLESSFSIEKSIGYLEWLSKRTANSENE